MDIKGLFSSFDSNMPWLKERTIFLTKHGSHAYGTNTPTSDLDIKGVAVPGHEYFLGFSRKFEQAESRSPNDLVVYDIRKFFAMAADCNPNICEVLWTDPADYLICNRFGQLMVENRHLFSSKKARYTFSGYAHAQLKRIRGHYQWLKNPPQAPPTRAEFGLPEQRAVSKDQMDAALAAIKKRMDSWEPNLDGVDPATRIQIMADIQAAQAEILAGTERFMAAGVGLGFEANFLELLDKERRYKAKQTEWAQYQNWLKTRNQARAELEAKHGYDTKHGMHLVRLLRMCREILTTGKVIVKRPDAEELLAIRNGAMPYDDLVAWAESEDKAMDALYKSSTLPHAPDREELDKLCIEIVRSMTIERKP
jgi:hypothetical protein